MKYTKEERQKALENSMFLADDRQAVPDHWPVGADVTGEKRNSRKGLPAAMFSCQAAPGRVWMNLDLFMRLYDKHLRETEDGGIEVPEGMSMVVGPNGTIDFVEKK